jgi:peptidylprolyl isomerase
MMKYGTVILSIFFAGCSSNLLESRNDILSFHYGYALQKQFEATGMPQNMDQFRAGMEAAKRGDPFPFSDEVLDEVFTNFEDTILEKQKIKNLSQAENYLEKISLDSSVIELIPQKLYYRELKKGDGQLIGPEDILLANYSAAILEGDKEEIIFFPRVSPTSISIGDTIIGFSRGIEGMHIGERRKLFIHPELAYGTFGGKIDPNQLLIIDVEAVGIAPLIN